jgi:hypothetical protein
MFKTFYEVVRVKVVVKDASKIPHERLYEMNLKLFLISFIVEGEEASAEGKKDEGGDDGDGKGEYKTNDDLNSNRKDTDGASKEPGNTTKTPNIQQSKQNSWYKDS